MKLSNKQANILANEVYKQLQANTEFVPESTKRAIKKFVDDREKLMDAKNKASEAINGHDRKLKSIIGKAAENVSPYNDADRIIKECERRNTPTISQIEDKIILKAMFADESDMNAFVEKIVREFSKKRPTLSHN